MSLKDKAGAEHLVCGYAKIKPPLDTYEWGQAVWNEKTASFDKLRTIWTKSADQPKQPLVPEGIRIVERRRWQRVAAVRQPAATIRMPATFEAWQDPTTWGN